MIKIRTEVKDGYQPSKTDLLNELEELKNRKRNFLIAVNDKNECLQCIHLLQSRPWAKEKCWKWHVENPVSGEEIYEVDGGISDSQVRELFIAFFEGKDWKKMVKWKKRC